MAAIAKLVGERIRSLRRSKGITQERLAELADMNRSYIGQLERGEKNATLETVENVALALNVSFEILFEHIVSGDESNQIPAQVYDIVSAQPPPVQQEMKNILLHVEKILKAKSAKQQPLD